MKTRDICFRAWDSRNKKMIPELITTEQRDGYIGVNVCSPGGRITDIMQYTGLKDCKGKKIYEGDILHSIYGEKGNVAGFVEYRAFEFVVKRKNRTSWHRFGCVCDKEGEIYKVIGNVHEDPDLLKVGKK